MSTECDGCALRGKVVVGNFNLIYASRLNKAVTKDVIRIDTVHRTSIDKGETNLWRLGVP